MSFLSRLFGSNSAPESEPPVGDLVRIGEVEAILAELRPIFLADGGDMQLVAISDAGDVAVRLVGACGHCSLSSLTLKGALEPKLRESLTWFKSLSAS